MTTALDTRLPVAPNLRVAVVLTTFNRRQTVLWCLQLLTQQTRTPDAVYVVDNGSTDGTADEIRRIYGVSGPIEVIPLAVNLGNAGGIRLAMEKALATEAEAVWILDDDSWPDPQALEKLLGHFSPTSVCSSLVMNPEGNDLAWPCVVMGPRPSVVNDVRSLPPAEVFEIRGAWLGALISREIIAEVGLPNADFFIRGEDEEYPSRIGRCGRRFFCVHASVLKHPMPQGMLRFEFWGRNFFYEPRLPLWKAYYIVRNRTFIHRNHASSAVKGCIKAWAGVLFSVAMAIGVDDQKSLRVATYLKAGWRGFLGKLGKEPEFG